MPQSQYQAAIEAERRLKYQGSARIHLDVLHFGRAQPRELDTRHVKFLKQCFRNEDCQRLPARNHVPAIISRQQLVDTMRSSGVSAQQLLVGQPSGYPGLEFPTGVKLECLHGRHRIEAGREYLLPTEKWWIVDLYLPDLNTDLRSWLVEEYSNESKPSDGEIYQKLRQYDAERNLSAKLRWKSRLLGIRLKSLNTLYKHEDLTDGFDALLDIPGLWHDMKLSTIHKVLPLRCNEEILHYLRHIKRVWSGLVQGNQNAMLKIDRATVEALQMRAPQASTTDAKLLRSQLRAGEIFHAFNDSEREDIWSRLQTIEGLIPSFYTFFRDVQYLEDCVNCVKRLTAVSPQQSLSSAMKGRFTGVNQRQGQVKVQITEDRFIYKHGTPQDQVDFGYRQIHAFAMRHWPNMPKEPETEDPQMRTPIKADSVILRRFADLAAELGFKSDQITDLQQFPGGGVAPTEHSQSRPVFVTPGKGVPVKKRCGKPSTREFKEDQPFLFINYLQNDERQEQGSSVTSLFVRISVYLAFFGKSPAIHDSSQIDETSQNAGGSPQGSGIHESTFSPIVDTEQSELSAEHSTENYDGILTLYQQRDARSEQRDRSNITEEELSEGSMDMDSMQDWQEEQERERKEQERLELRRLEETLERDDLNEGFAQRLQAQENLEQEEQREREQKKREQERQEEDQRRQATRHQQRREEEAKVYGRTLRDAERNKNRHTLFDLERIGNARQEASGSDAHSSRVPVVVSQSSDFARRLRTPTIGQSSERKKILEQGKLQQEKLERERLEQSRRADLEQERLEEKQMEKRLDQERLELERLELERLELERLELERLELERLELERLELERLELERQNQARLEQERLEQERKRLTQLDLEGSIPIAYQAQEHRQAQTEISAGQVQGKVEQRRAKREGKNLRQEILEAQQEERRKRQDRRREEENTIESEEDLAVRLTRARPRGAHDSTLLAQPPDSIWITFKVRERGVWRTAEILHVRSSDPSEVERLAVKHMRKKKQMRLFDTNLNILTPRMCFQAAVADRANMLLIIPESESDINEELQASVSQLLSELDSERRA